MFRSIARIFAAVCAVAMFAACAPSSVGTEECDLRDNGCFGLDWKTATPAAVEQWLSGGGDVRAKDRNGLTPLHWAAWLNENPAIIDALIAAGAEVGVRAEYKLTPLHWAAQYNANPAVIDALVVAGADVWARNTFLLAPLHLAVIQNKNPAVADKLRALQRVAK